MSNQLERDRQADSPAQRRAQRPKGIILLTLLFYAAALLVVVASLAAAEFTIPSDIVALTSIYLFILGWGLWKLYRWAWFATLIMLGLSVIRLLSDAALVNQPIGWAMIFIAVCSSYLLWPNVRRTYLSNGWEPAEAERAA